MNTLETLKAMRQECIQRADALDYVIRMLESSGQFTQDEDMDYSAGTASNKKKKNKAGTTSFTVSSRTEPAVIPHNTGGILMWEDTDDLHG